MEFLDSRDARLPEAPGRSWLGLVSEVTRTAAPQTGWCFQMLAPWHSRFVLARGQWSLEGWGGRELKSDSHGPQCCAGLCVSYFPSPLSTLPCEYCPPPVGPS